MYPKLTDAEIDALSPGAFYQHMINQDHREWARQANRMAKLGLNQNAEDTLASWFANAMCATDDRRTAKLWPVNEGSAS